MRGHVGGGRYAEKPTNLEQDYDKNMLNIIEGPTCEPHTPVCYLSGDWNVEYIFGCSDKDSTPQKGFIVQKVTKIINPSIGKDASKGYFEAWRVEGSKVVKPENSNMAADDTFSFGKGGFIRFPTIKDSLGTTGEIHFLGDVYWVSYNNALFSDIEQWPEGAVPEAGNLPAIEIDTLPGIEELYVGRRIPLHHSWDLSSEETVAQVLREELQRYTQHDKTLDKFSENLSEAIQRLTTQGSPFRSLAERIGEELYERFITER